MTTPVSAGIYCRISLTNDGDRTKVDDQERICRDLAARLGWQVASVFVDNGQSAWKHNRKRPGWDAMLAAAEAGAINAIVIYHNDRLVRQGWDLEVLIRLAEGKGILLASPTGTRNLDNADDRFVMRIEAAVATRSSDDTSRRKKAQIDRWRREGKVRPGGVGGRAFGFASNGVDHVDAEAAVIREAAARVLDGQTPGEIAAWMRTTGTATPAGKEWTHFRVRRLLARPRYAGLMPDGVSAAAWAPVIDRAEWEQVCAALAARAATHSFATSGTVRYLLSGIARCGKCDATMAMHSSHGKGRPLAYGCHSCGRVMRNMELLDAYITGRVITRLANAANPAPRSPEQPGLAREFAALTTARAEAAAAVEDPATPHLPLLLARLDRVEKRLAELREMASESARERLIREHAGISREEFDARPLSLRRALVDACFEIRVLPASRRGAGFHREDVEVTAR